ncbi:uncharacterized protein DS421_13g407840 [Arachis hypogaea]|nr:uncharacterized protein DS421_13g407840 [Arachis hypogaea]
MANVPNLNGIGTPLTPSQPCVSSLSSSTVHHSRRLTVAHGVTFTSSLTRRSPHLVGRHTQSLTALPRRALSVSHLGWWWSSSSCFSRSLSRTWSRSLPSLRSSSPVAEATDPGGLTFVVVFLLRALPSASPFAISFSFAINFLRATRFGEFPLVFLLQFWCCINAL